MNLDHLRTFLWLHWRLRRNQFQRAGTVNAVIFAAVTVVAVVSSIFSFAGSFAVGLWALANAEPATLMYVWDGLVAAMLFCWTIGLLADLQRAEAVSLQNFLHLPVSVSGVFVLNYLSSLLTLTTILFVPAMVGLSLGLVVSRGAAMLLVLPALAAFLLMVTALTYQFQGWLAALMANKRRRNTVVVCVTMGFILIAQAPNLINIYRPWKNLNGVAGADVAGIALVANLLVPAGWLPLGAMGAAAGNILWPLGATLAMSLIGALSLARAYKTTLRLYTGDLTGDTTPLVNPPREIAAVPTRLQVADASATSFLERGLPGLSEQATAIALASFRSLTRAPEVKMMILSSIVMVVIFGGMMARGSGTSSSPVRFLIACGAQAMTLLTVIQLIGNQFGFDRGGFRMFVLCPAPRRDILLGKNLAVAPLALGLGAATAILVQAFYPMRFDFFLALLPQMISMYLIFCMMANLLAIYAPMPIAPGTIRPVQTKTLPILLHMSSLFVFAILLAPTLVPLVVQVVAEHFDWMPGVPFCLILAAIECVLVVLIYSLILTWEGSLLQTREQTILETVSVKAE